MFTPLLNNISTEYIQRLAQCGLAEALQVTENGFTHTFKSYISYFHPRRHIPLTNPACDMKFSPVIGYLFAVCKSKQSAQCLTECGGVKKYISKYITKMDQQNFVIINVDGEKSGALTTKGQI
eukprot:477461-Ditylum_brightwellii.AAC.1